MRIEVWVFIYPCPHFLFSIIGIFKVLLSGINVCKCNYSIIAIIIEEIFNNTLEFLLLGNPTMLWFKAESGHFLL